MKAPVEEPDEDELWSEKVAKADEERRANPLREHEGKSLEELQDSVPADTYESLRRKRLAELKQQAARNRFGSVVHIGEAEWQSEVTKQPEDVWVVVHLFMHGKQECDVVDRALAQLAPRFKDVKFCRIEGAKAIRNYPDRNCPTLLIYKAGDIQLQLVGLAELGGPKTNAATLEWALAKLGALRTELQEDPTDTRMRVTRGGTGAGAGGKEGEREVDASSIHAERARRERAEREGEASERGGAREGGFRTSAVTPLDDDDSWLNDD